jgi:hypothetical protein
MQKSEDEDTENSETDDGLVFPSVEEWDKELEKGPGEFLSNTKGNLKRSCEKVVREHDLKNPDVGYAKNGEFCFRPPGGGEKIGPLPDVLSTCRYDQTTFLHCECYISFPLDSVGKTDFMTKLSYPSDENYETDEFTEPLYTVTESSKFFNSYYLVVGKELMVSEINPAEWLVDLIYDNFEQIKEHNPDKIVFTLSYETQEPCFMLLRWEMTSKIALMEADLCTSC